MPTLVRPLTAPNNLQASGAFIAVIPHCRSISSHILSSAGKLNPPLRFHQVSLVGDVILIGPINPKVSRLTWSTISGYLASNSSQRAFISFSVFLGILITILFTTLFFPIIVPSTY